MASLSPRSRSPRSRSPRSRSPRSRSRSSSPLPAFRKLDVDGRSSLERNYEPEDIPMYQKFHLELLMEEKRKFTADLVDPRSRHKRRPTRAFFIPKYNAFIDRAKYFRRDYLQWDSHYKGLWRSLKMYHDYFEAGTDFALELATYVARLAGLTRSDKNRAVYKDMEVQLLALMEECREYSVIIYDYSENSM